MINLARLLGLILLAGTAMVAAGAAVHPVLSGDATEQLRTIADTRYWRQIHLVMLAGTALVVCGVWVRMLHGRSAPVSPGLVAALAMISLGVAINGLNIAYMTGSGWRMAARFIEGEASVAQLFDLTHPIGLVAARYGNLLVAIGAVVLGWAERFDEGTPDWLAWLAWVAAAGGLIGVIFFHESSRATLGAVALLSGWQVATGLRAVRGTSTRA
ncbi:MAG TPA: hypothetical protein VMM18_15250 [Gemmatimonadaceae bacterium]|nr:hypothetical protein [Gemmatimonadaceae bacterium]